jgi:proline dehydrogenase
MLAEVSKNVFLHVSQNRVLNKAAKKWGLKFGASQVVAGDTIESAIRKVNQLNQKGLVCTLDHLGEFVSSREEAVEATQYNVRTLEAMGESGVKCNLSVKMTQLGLDIDSNFCLENMRRILETAKKYNNFVRNDNVGTVIQAYLFRAEQDVKDLKGISLRLVKGAYQESPTVAYQEKTEIDNNYMRIIEEHLLSGSYTAIASHDHNIIEKVKEFAKKHHINRNQFEFQMLYGFRTDMQLSLVKEGYKMRVYVPFGNDWFGYFMRRMAERPQNVAFALKGFFSK